MEKSLYQRNAKIIKKLKTMKLSKLTRKLRELPEYERELLIKQELKIIEGKKAIDQANRATIEFRKTLSELKAHSEDFINLIKLWHETNEIG